MVDREELRRLAETASANRKHMVAVGTAASCRDTEISERAFRYASSPDVVLGLLDEIERLREVFVAERDQHVAHNRAMISQREAERETLMKIAEEFKAERDQLRAVAVRLKGALLWADDVIESEWPPGHENVRRVRELLADPEVEKL